MFEARGEGVEAVNTCQHVDPYGEGLCISCGIEAIEAERDTYRLALADLVRRTAESYDWAPEWQAANALIGKELNP